MTKFVMKEKGWVYTTEDGEYFLEKADQGYWAVLYAKNSDQRCYFRTLSEAKAYVRRIKDGKKD